MIEGPTVSGEITLRYWQRSGTSTNGAPTDRNNRTTSTKRNNTGAAYLLGEAAQAWRASLPYQAGNDSAPPLGGATNAICRKKKKKQTRRQLLQKKAKTNTETSDRL